MRTAKTDGGRTEFVMEGLKLEAELANGSTIATYRWGNQLIGEARGGTAKTILQDRFRSPLIVLDQAGTITDRIRYSAAGEIRQRVGSSPWAFGFGGYLTQSGTDELYAFARTYAPSLARFNEVDPVDAFDSQIPMGPHRYVMGYGNPLVYSDPDGRRSFLTDNVENFNESDGILRDNAEHADGELAGIGWNLARGGMMVASTPSRLINSASDWLAQSAPMRMTDLTANVADEAAADVAPFAEVVAHPGDTGAAIYENSVNTVSYTMGGERGAASDLFSFGVGLAAGAKLPSVPLPARVVSAGRVVRSAFSNVLVKPAAGAAKQVGQAVLAANRKIQNMARTYPSAHPHLPRRFAIC